MKSFKAEMPAPMKRDGVRDHCMSNTATIPIVRDNATSFPRKTSRTPRLTH